MLVRRLSALLRRVERALRAMASESGFRAREHHVEIVGVCPDCQKPA